MDIVRQAFSGIEMHYSVEIPDPEIMYILKLFIKYALYKCSFGVSTEVGTLFSYNIGKGGKWRR